MIAYKKSNKMAGTVRKLLGTVLPGVLKPLRVLWNEVIGFMFLSIAVIFAFATWRRKEEIEFPLMVLSIAFIAMLAAFGVSSFWRARKINRS